MPCIKNLWLNSLYAIIFTLLKKELWEFNEFSKTFNLSVLIIALNGMKVVSTFKIKYKEGNMAELT